MTTWLLDYYFSSFQIICFPCTFSAKNTIGLLCLGQRYGLRSAPSFLRSGQSPNYRNFSQAYIKSRFTWETLKSKLMSQFINLVKEIRIVFALDRKLKEKRIPYSFLDL